MNNTSTNSFNEILNKIYNEGLKRCISPLEAKKHNDAIDKRKRDKCLSEAYKKSNLPILVYDFKLGNYKLLDFISKNINNSICLLSKKSGVCKTRTMIYLAEQNYLLKNKNIRFYTAAELARKLSVSAYSDNRFVNELCRLDLLIIDDLAKQKNTERVEADIFEIIDYRYLRSLPTWISTNHLGIELEEKFGERGAYLVRRIKEVYKIWHD